MTPPSESAPRRAARRRSYGVAPYEPGRTTREYVADGTMRLVEADDEVAALRAYAAATGLTAIADPVRSTSGKRVLLTLSDGRDYVARYLKAAIAETMPEEPIVAPPSPPPTESDPPADVDGDDQGGGASPSPDPPAPPPTPLEFIPLGAVSPGDLARVRDIVQPRSWEIAAALWGLADGEPRSVQEVAERFATSPGFVQTVAASMLRLAAAGDDPPAS